jgi:Trk K+ transport system NAD-binding subunit
MKIFIALSKNYFRLIANAISNVKPPPRVLIASDDEEVEALCKYSGFEFKRLADVKNLEELRECDIAILALAEDSENIALLKVVKDFNVPIIIALLHNKNNRDVLIGEGVHYIVDVDEYLYANLSAMLLPDTWIFITPISLLSKVKMALYRVLRRALLGISYDDIKGAFSKLNLNIYVEFFNRFGNRASGHVLAAGDYIVISGFDDDVKQAVKELEKLFRKFEEIQASRTLQQIKSREYG